MSPENEKAEILANNDGIGSSQANNEYFVSPHGNDDNPGTLEAPWKTIGKSVNKLKPGQTLNIREGTYNEKFEIEVSGTKDQPITIQSYNNERVIISGMDIDISDYIIYMNGISNIRIIGLEVCNNVTKGSKFLGGIYYESFTPSKSGSNIQLINNKVYRIRSEGDAHGIAFYGRHYKDPITDILLDGNEVYDCRLGSSESIVINGNIENFTVINNIVHDNNNIGIDFIGFEKVARDNGEISPLDYARNGVCRNNIVYNISSNDNEAYWEEDDDAPEGGYYSLCADGIYVDGGSHITIEDNYVYNCDIGIEVASEHLDMITGNVTVRNNVISGCQGYCGIAFGGYDSKRGWAEECEFVNNTLYNNSIGIVVQKSRGNVIKNNIITGGEYVVDLTRGYETANNFGPNFWFIDGHSYKELKGIGNEMLGLQMFEDPLLVDPDNEDFSLDANSPAQGFGSKITR